jgi:site-specific DNA-methyltransferase (adenine-specific)
VNKFLGGFNLIELNKIYQIDNLELMKQMESESVDLIYCDILYNTGKKFKDYDDRLGTPQQAINWYTPRLLEMYRVLKRTGSIYLQCDYRLIHYLKVKIDEIFGYKNFKNEIIWYYKSPSGTVKSNYANKHDNILFYSKSNTYTFNVDAVREEYAENTIKQAKNKNISFGRETKLNDKGKTPTDVWEIPVLNSMAKERVGYDTQKPESLLEKIIKASSNEGDLVGDFFCGSGTTLAVAKRLNRKYIGCDINQKAVHLTNERLKEIS